MKFYRRSRDAREEECKYVRAEGILILKEGWQKEPNWVNGRYVHG